MGPLTPTKGPISEIQHGCCSVASLEKIKHIANTKYIETVCILYQVCLKLKIQTKASLAPITLEVRFSRHWSQCFFESTLAHEHCTEAHTHNTADSPKRHWVSWYTYNSIVILLSYADDFKTAQQVACRVSECETSVTTLSN